MNHPKSGHLVALSAALFVALFVSPLVGVHPLAAQTPLFLVNDETEVGALSFRFDSTRTFEVGELKTQIATAAPGFFDRIKRLLPFMDPPPYPFSPLELQRDVARLRLFYRENGFLRARIGYAPSRLDTAKNRIHVVFSIDEGPPVIVQSVTFLGLGGEAFPATTEPPWDAFDRATTLQPGDRYTRFERLQTSSQTLAWLRERGYAFAEVRDTVVVDSTALTAALRLYVDPGPLAYFDDVAVEGNERVSRRVIVRELPFRPGQRFAEGKLTQGQRELFALNLFRIALTDLPEQPRDSTVSVLVRVREGKAQLATYRAGFGRESGFLLEGTYDHRNFLGGARTLTTSLILNSGFGAVPTGGRLPARLFRVSVALRQPYLFVTQLSGTVAPFVQYETDPLLEPSDRTMGINAREVGLNTGLLYEVLPFRTVSLQHTFSRSWTFTDPAAEAVGLGDRFNRSILTLSGTFGRSDDYLNPARGVLLRPTLEMAGRFLGSGVAYFKAAGEATAYRPFTRRVGAAGRLYAGRLWPTGASRDQDDPIIENRFDPIRFYLGGGNDLRGWGDQLAGPKRARPVVVDGDTTGYQYEPVGGLSKVAAGVELRLPFPGLGPEWGTAVFTDAGSLSEGGFSFGDLRIGAGAGLRYRTPVGFVRLDVAYKVTPDEQDLRAAEDYFFEGDAAPAKWLRRFALHLSIGQSY